MDKFFTQETCDRCGGSLKEGRIMSMFNTDCICMKCKQEETERPDYEAARDAEHAEVCKGNLNFEGVEAEARKYDMNWSVEFDITLDGCQASFFDLDDAAQEYLCEQIKQGCMHGTTGGVSLRRL